MIGIGKKCNFAVQMKIKTHILFLLICLPFFVHATGNVNSDTVYLQEVNVSAIKQDANLRTIGVASTIVDRKET